MTRIQRAPRVVLFLAAMTVVAVVNAAPAFAKPHSRMDRRDRYGRHDRNDRNDYGWKVDERRPGSFLTEESAVGMHLSYMDVAARDNSVPSFETIHFDLDQDELKSEYRDEVDRIGETLAAHPEWSVEIQGHADDTGTADYNQDLSRRRARTVFRHLASKYPGVADQMRIRAFGETEPVRTNNSPSDRARNRRVEFVVFSRRP